MGATTSQFAVGLGGQDFDLADLRRIFSATSDIIVTELHVPDGKVTALLSNEFTGVASGLKVVEPAERVLGELNGILFAADPDRSPVVMGAVYERTHDRTWSRGMFYINGLGSGSGARVPRGQ